MRKNRLGQTNLHLTVIGLGTWAIGGTGWKFSWGPQDDRESIATIRRALDLGVNWIDTAPLYGLGHAEQVVGKAVREVGDKPMIATKCGRFGDRDGTVSSRINADSIRSEVEASLRRLRVDVIDLYQIHWPRPEADIEEAWETVAALVEEGKVRYGGVCNFSAAQLERVQPIRRVESLQSPYSMIERDVECSVLGYCSQHSIGFLAYSPMQKGLLSGKFSQERVGTLPADDHRRNDPNFQGTALDANLRLAAGLRALADQSGKTPAQLATAWVLGRPTVTAAIVGARDSQQIAETVIAADVNLSHDEVHAVDRLLDDHTNALRRVGMHREARRQ